MLPLSADRQNQAIPMILFIFLLQFGLSVASTSLNEASDATILLNKGGREQREFDYFVLALQWPGTICKRTRHCCSSNACCNRSGAFADFTIRKLKLQLHCFHNSKLRSTDKMTQTWRYIIFYKTRILI